MKVILKNDISNLGSLGEVVTVANGYARNYLIPRGFALEATRGNINQFGAEREALERKNEKLRGEAATLADELGALSLSFHRKAGEEEKLFGSVTSKDIEAELKEKGFDIDRKKILMSEPLKTLGVSTVAVKIHPKVTAELKVWIVKE